MGHPMDLIEGAHYYCGIEAKNCGISGRQLPEDPSRLLTCVGDGKARGAVSGNADGDSCVGDPPHLESPLSGEESIV